MKTNRFVAVVLFSVTLVSLMVACKKAPREELECDFVFDMDDYEFFSDVFNDDQWEDKGPYTVLLNGLLTPVVLKMDGMTVKTVNAYGQILQLDQETYQGYVGIEIEAAEGVLIIYQIDDYERACWLLTEEKCYDLTPKDGYSTTVHVRDDGTLRYYRSWCEYETSFNQEAYAPLYYCTSRDHVLYQSGTAEIADGQLRLMPEKTVTASDEYDLNAMFSEAKADEYAGEYFSRFETVDQALAANTDR